MLTYHTAEIGVTAPRPESSEVFDTLPGHKALTHER